MNIIRFNQKNEIFRQHLELIDKVRFTQREMDVIACYVNNRSGQNIASLLSVSPRTVGAHLYNVRTKLGSIPKNKIIDFIETSGKLAHLRKYYEHLNYEMRLERFLLDIAATKNLTTQTYNVICRNINDSVKPLFNHIRQKLEMINILFSYKENNIKTEYKEKDIEVICLESSSESQNFKILLPQTKSFSETIIDFSSNKNPYLALAELIEALSTADSIAILSKSFQTDIKNLVSSLQSDTNTVYTSKKIPVIKNPLFTYGIVICVMITIIFSVIRLDKPSELESLETISFNLPQPYEHHIKRNKIIDEINNKLFDKVNPISLKLVGLHGLGGAGKTAIARYYANNVPKKYQFIGWFTAESLEVLESQYLELGEKYKLFSKDISLKNKISLVKEWFESMSTVLLVYDNIKDANTLKTYLPKKGHIILTSRNDNVSTPIEVGVMSEKQSILLLSKLLGSNIKKKPNYRERVKQLSQKLGYLPLALSQAAAYITANCITIDKYLKLYDKNKDKLLTNTAMPPMDTHLPAYISWDLSMHDLEKQKDGKEALKILHFITCLSKDNIPIKLISEYLYNTSAEESEIELNILLSKLKQYSLIKKTNANSFSIHRLVHSWLASKLSNEKKKIILRKAIRSIKKSYPHRRLHQTDLEYIIDLIPHAESILHMSKTYLNESDYCYLYSILGKIYYNLGYYDKSLEFFKYAVKINDKCYKSITPEKLEVLDNMGKLYTKLGKYQTAEKYLKMSLQTKENYFNTEDVSIAHTLQYLGRVYLYKGKYHKAKIFLKKSLEIQRNYYGENSTEIAHILSNLGDLYLFTEDHLNAREVLETGLDIMVTTYGYNHVATSSILHSLGSTYLMLHNFDKSLELLESALKTQIEFFGDKSSNVAYIRSYLGIAYLNSGQVKKAEYQLKTALKIRQSLYGNDHIETSYTMHNLAIVYLYNGNYHEAEKLIEQSLLIKKQHFDTESHIEVAITYDCLVFIKQLLNKHSEACKILEESFKITSNVYKDRIHNTIEVIADYGNTLRFLGKKQKSEEMLLKAKKLAKEHFKNEFINTAIINVNLALLYESRGEHDKKKTLLKEALEIFEKELQPSHPYITRTKQIMNREQTEQDIGIITRILIA